MVWPAHWLLRIEGDFRVGGSTVVETWSNSIRFSGVGTPTPPLEWLEDTAVPAIETYYNKTTLSNTVWVTTAKFNAIDPDGRYANQDETNAYYWTAGDEPHGTSTTVVEPQRTLAVSWTTAAQRGRASKGRIFLPGFASPVGQDLLIAESLASAIESDSQTFLNNLNAGTYTAAIVSGVGTGALRPITGARVGRAIDTQRRRRRSLNEQWVNQFPDTVS